MRHRTLLERSLIALLCLAIALSAISPHDRLTWVLEITPALIILPLLVATHDRFPLSSLLYALITLHGLGLIVGAYYSFARVPLGFWIQDWLELSRNPYDRLGHFMQGLTPTLLAREILIRLRLVNGPRMLAFLCACVAMAASAVYELIEWWAALALGQGATQFLGMQGDEWDTQADMFCALLGAITALTLFAPVHDRSLKRFQPASAGQPTRAAAPGQVSHRYD